MRWFQAGMQKGTLTVRRGAATIEQPLTPEAFTTMQLCYQMVALRHTNRPDLQGHYARVFSECKEYLLGGYVYGLNARDASGQTVSAPPWELLISYEMAIRREVAKQMNQVTKPFTAALKEAWKDATTKERRFVTPLALSTKRPTLSTPWDPAWGRWTTKGKDNKGKGKGKDKGKERRRSVLEHCQSHMPDGSPVCYRFNTSGEACKQKECKFKLSVASASVPIPSSSAPPSTASPWTPRARVPTTSEREASSASSTPLQAASERIQSLSS